MYSTETVQSFLRRARKRMDQEFDAETNFWSASEMIEYMNEGIREVYESMRETQQNWFVRTLTSRDGIVKIGGRDYDCAQLQIVMNRDKLFLPADYQQLQLFEPLRIVIGGETDDSAAFPTIVLEYANMTERKFRNDVSRNPSFGVRRYYYDIVFAAEGPYIFISPPFSFEQPQEVQISYVASPANLTLLDTFEGTCFTNMMVDAVLAYTVYAAGGKEGIDADVKRLERTWSLKRELATRAAGPKQTRDEEAVKGYLEEEL